MAETCAVRMLPVVAAAGSALSLERVTEATGRAFPTKTVAVDTASVRSDGFRVTWQLPLASKNYGARFNMRLRPVNNATREVRLPDEARDFPTAARMLEVYDEIELIGSGRDRRPRTIKIGVTELTAITWLPRFIGRIKERNQQRGELLYAAFETAPLVNR